MSVYGKMGGAGEVDRAVNKFYRKVLQDERISVCCDGVDVDGQRACQKVYLPWHLGG